MWANKLKLMPPADVNKSPTMRSHQCWETILSNRYYLSLTAVTHVTIQSSPPPSPIGSLGHLFPSQSMIIHQPPSPFILIQSVTATNIIHHFIPTLTETLHVQGQPPSPFILIQSKTAMYIIRNFVLTLTETLHVQGKNNCSNVTYSISRNSAQYFVASDLSVVPSTIISKLKNKGNNNLHTSDFPRVMNKLLVSFNTFQNHYS